MFFQGKTSLAHAGKNQLIFLIQVVWDPQAVDVKIIGFPGAKMPVFKVDGVVKVFVEKEFAHVR